MAENVLFCSQCGGQNTYGAVFCQKCGASLGPSLPAVPVAPPIYPQAVSSAGYGGFWIRFLAFLLDAIILGIATWPIRMMVVGTLGMHRFPTEPIDARHLAPFFFLFSRLWGLNAIASWLYDALLTSSPWQGTVGKKILNLKVTDEGGSRISFARATGRHFAKYLSAMILFIGYFMIAFTDRKRGLHDILAGTFVRKG
jgi:uncharacterized RDD family membrane protein YckC